MSETPPPRVWSGTPRWVKWLLSLSLALNFIVLGLAAGAAIKFHRHGHGHGGVATIGHIMWALPRDSRERAREMLKAARPDLKALREDRWAAKRAVADAIEATPFDPAATAAAFTALRAKDQSTKAWSHGVMVDILEGLSAEERADVAQSLRKRRERKKD